MRVYRYVMGGGWWVEKRVMHKMYDAREIARCYRTNDGQELAYVH